MLVRSGSRPSRTPLSSLKRPRSARSQRQKARAFPRVNGTSEGRGLSWEEKRVRMAQAPACWVVMQLPTKSWSLFASRDRRGLATRQAGRAGAAIGVSLRSWGAAKRPGTPTSSANGDGRPAPTGRHPEAADRGPPYDGVNAPKQRDSPDCRDSPQLNRPVNSEANHLARRAAYRPTRYCT